MIDESRVLLAAGTDTTARALSVITYHLLADPARLKKLKAELDTALPDPDTIPNCSQVEALPYLVCLHRLSILSYGLPYDRMQSYKKDSVSIPPYPYAKKESHQMKISTTMTRRETNTRYLKA
jgi:cytochrome P450